MCAYNALVARFGALGNTGPVNGAYTWAYLAGFAKRRCTVLPHMGQNLNADMGPNVVPFNLRAPG